MKLWWLLVVAAMALILCGALGGLAGIVYAGVFVLATLPGWPVGRLIWGAGHPAGWLTGAVVGYGLTALSLWLPIAVRAAWWFPFGVSWCAITALTWFACGRFRTSETSPRFAWDRGPTLGLVAALLVTLAVAALPYGHVGRMDEAGNRRYRAYFTADFVWHEALTAELARLDVHPLNPYLASRRLSYYWAYFLLPGVATAMVQRGLGGPAPIEAFLLVNGLCTALVFVATLFLLAWVAVPRAGPAAIGTVLAVVASSAEGLYAMVELARKDVPFSALRGLNIDAISSWWFGALSVDGLQRAIWYTPQHSMAYTLGLLALVIAARHGSSMRPAAAAVAGLCLGLSLMMSPFSGGSLTLVYALAILWGAASTGTARDVGGAVATQLPAIVLVVAAFAWCVVNRTFEGAGGAVAFGLSSRSSRTTPAVLMLMVGPALAPAVVGAAIAAVRRFPREIRPAVLGVAVALMLAYGVTLVLEDIWIGWRAGHLLLAFAPGLIALATVSATARLGQLATTAALLVLLALGLPTTIIDLYNAQDTDLDAMGPGFRWTVVLSPPEQEALAWIDQHTPGDAVVQMSIGPRGRETWSLIPSFAHRRMAAGQPISLLHLPEYDEASARADTLYSETDAYRAWQLARGLGVNYVYVGPVEREAFGEAGLSFPQRSDLFRPVFEHGPSAVYAVR